MAIGFNTNKIVPLIVTEAKEWKTALNDYSKKREADKAAKEKEEMRKELGNAYKSQANDTRIGFKW